MTFSLPDNTCRLTRRLHPAILFSGGKSYSCPNNIKINKLLKNVFEAADTRQEQAEKRCLCMINEHPEPVFNTVAAPQIVLQQPVKETKIAHLTGWINNLACSKIKVFTYQAG